MRRHGSPTRSVSWEGPVGEAKAGTGAFGGGLNGTTTYRHFEGNNPLMHDGHVENRPKAEVYYFNAAGTYNAASTEALWHIYK